jgi:two-component system NtrC family sensor kinase
VDSPDARSTDPAEAPVQERYDASIETLKQERDWLRTLLDNLNEGVAACDNDGKLTVLNRKARDWHGVADKPGSVDDLGLEGRLFRPDGVTPLSHDEIPLNRALQGEDVRSVEVVIAAEGRPHRLVSVSGNALHDNEGNKLGALVVMHDLAQRTRADAAEVELATELTAAEVRRREALRINDRVVQSLVAAAWVWDDDVAKARASLTKALGSATDIVGGLIGELKVEGEISAGILRNDDPQEPLDE